ncbi:MAG: IucA/IucC family protein [Patescibacteria group bacterium]
MFTKLDKNEKEVWDWGLGKDFSPKLLTNKLFDSRRSSIERFIGSFLRENIGEIINHCTWYARDDWITKNQSFSKQYSHKWKKEETKEIVEISLGNDKLLILPVCGFPLERFYLTTLPLLRVQDKISELSNLSEIFSLFYNKQGSEQGDWESMRGDLLNSNANLFLAFLLREEYMGRLRENLSQKIYSEFHNKDEMLVFFEQWCVNGHFLHPTPKSKTGILLKDLLKLLPEAHVTYKLYLIALKKDKAHFLSISGSFDSFFVRLSNSLHEKVRKYIKNINANFEDYYFIPIHPWQYENFLKKRLATELDSNDYIFLEGIGVKVQPLIAFRTVYVPETSVYFKLPIDVQITSVKRTLSSKPCHNGIALSKVFDILKRKECLPNSFEIQLEIASVRLKEDYPSHKNLSFVTREGSIANLTEEDLILPASALFEKSPNLRRGKILEELISAYSLTTVQKAGGKKVVLEFFNNYIKILLPPALDLLTKYGIGIEAHLQNSIVVFRNGVPHRLIYRDLDAVNICTKRFSKHSFLRNEFYPNSWTVSEDAQAAQDKVMHSLIHSHIAEMINQINLIYDLNFEILWRSVAGLIRNHLDNLSKDSLFSNEAKKDIEYFFCEFTYIKSLFRMKLLGKTNEYIHIKTKNPLYLI